ncbi:phosphopantetheine-binding protein [Oceanobacillus massiliensis]|uniref:phosphopantetheine-binding protein n=1 Tax=Oceanobacillus massiliensis TaxID=1465765 RepID=UPI003017AD99
MNNATKTIEKTLMTARLFDGFWDRWVAHGILLSEIEAVRQTLLTIDDWVNAFSELGEKHRKEALIKQEAVLEEDVKEDLKENLKEELIEAAENSYRLAALYYNLAYWIYPNRCPEKMALYKKSSELVEKADRLSPIPCTFDAMIIDGIACPGRIRIPENPKGCIIIINPIDSSKEELYSYEQHFIDSHFITVSFDGPGQGETFMQNGLAIRGDNWKLFVDKLIDYAASKFPDLPIQLFGTSSGAAWSVYGSANPKVDKAAAVSPPIENGFSIPNYFGERISFITEHQQSGVLPNLTSTKDYGPVILFHGNKDVMVADQDIYDFYNSLPSPKELVEYPNEGHCCNFELSNVRYLSIEWFLDKENKTVTFHEFTKLISDLANIPQEHIARESKFRDDLGIDSLNMVNLFVQLAEETGISFNKFISAENIHTVANAYQVIEKEFTK